jgi:hypothetical protein
LGNNVCEKNTEPPPPPPQQHPHKPKYETWKNMQCPISIPPSFHRVSLVRVLTIIRHHKNHNLSGDF